MKKPVWLVFSGALAVYLLTLAPTVTGGDAGEFLAVACSGGVAHPPGYPLYILIARFIFHVPWGTMAWRMNIFSALCDAGATALVFLSLTEWTSSLWASLGGSLLFAFCPLVWTYATQTEVFALNNFFVSLLIYEALRFRKNPSRGTLLLTALTAGLAMANHHTSFFISFPVLVWMFWSLRQRGIKAFFLASALFFAGLLPYLDLLRGAHTPGAVIWGDPSHWKGVLGHILRLNYGTFRLATENNGPTSFWQHWFLFSRDFFRESLYVGPVLAAAGFILSIAKKKNRTTGLLLALSFFGYLVVFHGLANLRTDSPLFLGVLKRFWQEAYVIAFIWMGLAWAFLEEQIRPPLVTAMIVIAAVAAQVAVHWKDQNLRHHEAGLLYARAVLDPLPPNAVLLVRGDTPTNVVNYAQRCEIVRPDVRVLNQTALTYDWFKIHLGPATSDLQFPGARYDVLKESEPHSEGYDLKDFFESNLKDHSLFVASGLLDGDTSYQKDFMLWPAGLTDQVFRRDDEPQTPAWEADFQKTWSRINSWNFRQWASSPDESWDHEILDEVLRVQEMADYRIFTFALAHPERESLMEMAAAQMEALLSHHPRQPAYLYKNLGLAYQRLMAFHFPRAREKMISNWKHYLSLTPADDGQIPLIRKAVAGL